jgi:hypothetical protein
MISGLGDEIRTGDFLDKKEKYWPFICDIMYILQCPIK